MARENVRAIRPPRALATDGDGAGGMVVEKGGRSEQANKCTTNCVQSLAVSS